MGRGGEGRGGERRGGVGGLFRVLKWAFERNGFSYIHLSY
jgi:hypothetical protein